MYGRMVNEYGEWLFLLMLIHSGKGLEGCLGIYLNLPETTLKNLESMLWSSRETLRINLGTAEKMKPEDINLFEF